jgi:hypothetical protein
MRAAAAPRRMFILMGALALAFGPWGAAGATEEQAKSESVESPGRQALVGEWTPNADLSEDPARRCRRPW